MATWLELEKAVSKPDSFCDILGVTAKKNSGNVGSQSTKHTQVKLKSLYIGALTTRVATT